jgi:hypothetical protein
MATKPDAQTAAILKGSLRYALMVLRRELELLMGAAVKDPAERHRRQKVNAPYIDQVRRAIKVVGDHSTVP